MGFMTYETNYFIFADSTGLSWKGVTFRAKEIDPKGEPKVKMNVNNFARVTEICYSLQQLYESKNVYKRN